MNKNSLEATLAVTSIADCLQMLIQKACSLSTLGAFSLPTPVTIWVIMVMIMQVMTTMIKVASLF